jgi:hypothetical protein
MDQSGRGFLWLVSLTLLILVTAGCQVPAADVKMNDSEAAVQVGVYYYPWYYNDFHGRRYLRERLDPSQAPMLGEYNDRDAAVIKQHLEWSRYAGIDYWVTSWWGPGGREDTTTLEHILPHPDLGDLKIALFYETAGRMNDFTDDTNLRPDIDYIADNYFDHPNYLKIDGKPVLFIYLTRVLSQRGVLKISIDTIRSAANEKGYALFIVGDQVFGPTPGHIDDLPYLDAVTNYDVYGSMGAVNYATQAKVDQYYRGQEGWKQAAAELGVAFIPAVSPGFNDTGVRDGHRPLSRQLAEGEPGGSLFAAMLQGALPLTDKNVDRMLMVTSWNEWHEDTQIEPVKISPSTSADDSESGTAYTNGLSYEGYGLKYLDILRDVTDEP